jgi:hypothetical protein
MYPRSTSYPDSNFNFSALSVVDANVNDLIYYLPLICNLADAVTVTAAPG